MESISTASGARKCPSPVSGPSRQRCCHGAPCCDPPGVTVQRAQRVRVDHRADVGAQPRRIAHLQARPSQPASNRSTFVGDLLLQAQDPERRASLTRAVEARLDGIEHDLFGKGGTVDDHRVLPAGLRDQHRDWPVAAGERAMYRVGGFRRAGECHTGHPRVRHGSRADLERRRPAGTAARGPARRSRAASAPPRPRSTASAPPAWRSLRCPRPAPPRPGR